MFLRIKKKLLHMKIKNVKNYGNRIVKLIIIFVVNKKEITINFVELLNLKNTYLNYLSLHI